MKFDLQITISRLIALIMLVFGFTLSYILKEPSAFITSCSAAGVIIAIKTGFYAYGESRKSDVSSESSKTETTTTKTIEESSS
jgi:hypothetical protein